MDEGFIYLDSMNEPNDLRVAVEERANLTFSDSRFLSEDNGSGGPRDENA